MSISTVYMYAKLNTIQDCKQQINKTRWVDRLTLKRTAIVVTTVKSSITESLGGRGREGEKGEGGGEGEGEGERGERKERGEGEGRGGREKGGGREREKGERRGGGPRRSEGRTDKDWLGKLPTTIASDRPSNSSGTEIQRGITHSITLLHYIHSLNRSTNTHAVPSSFTFRINKTETQKYTVYWKSQQPKTHIRLYIVQTQWPR